MSGTDSGPWGANGEESLWEWFSLSYANFLVLPRVLMHAMPDEWQGKMAALLHEYDREFQNLPSIETRVSAVVDGKFSKFPRWLLNYRHPDEDEIDLAKNGPRTR